MNDPQFLLHVVSTWNHRVTSPRGGINQNLTWKIGGQWWHHVASTEPPYFHVISTWNIRCVSAGTPLFNLGEIITWRSISNIFGFHTHCLMSFLARAGPAPPLGRLSFMHKVPCAQPHRLKVYPIQNSRFLAAGILSFILPSNPLSYRAKKMRAHQNVYNLRISLIAAQLQERKSVYFSLNRSNVKDVKGRNGSSEQA